MQCPFPTCNALTETIHYASGLSYCTVFLKGGVCIPRGYFEISKFFYDIAKKFIKNSLFWNSKNVGGVLTEGCQSMSKMVFCQNNSVPEPLF